MLLYLMQWFVQGFPLGSLLGILRAPMAEDLSALCMYTCARLHICTHIPTCVREPPPSAPAPAPAVTLLGRVGPRYQTPRSKVLIPASSCPLVASGIVM